MADQTFLNATGNTRYRKATGTGLVDDPAVTHDIIDSVTPGTGATNLGKAEDAAHTSGDVGVMALVVRRDAPVAGAADGDYATLSVNSDGRLYVTTDGTVSVTGSVAVTGTFWQATQPVSIASTVTVTGTGGTFPVTDSGGSLTVDAPVATPVFVRLSDGSSAITTLPVSLASVPSHPVTNTGTFAVQVSSALPAGSNTIGNIGTIATSITPGTAAANLGKAEDAVHVSGDTGVAVWAVRRDTAASGAGTDGDYASLNVDANGRLYVNAQVTAALPAGTNNIGDVDVLSIAAGTNLVGDVGIGVRTGSGGLTGYVLNASAATNNATSVKTSAGRVYAIIATNNGAAARYLKFYNKASAPTPASDTPVATYMLPAGGGICRITDIGLVFSTGIAFAIVAGIGDNNNTSISADEVAVNIEYA